MFRLFYIYFVLRFLFGSLCRSHSLLRNRSLFFFHLVFILEMRVRVRESTRACTRLSAKNEHENVKHWCGISRSVLKSNVKPFPFSCAMTRYWALTIAYIQVNITLDIQCDTLEHQQCDCCSVRCHFISFNTILFRCVLAQWISKMFHLFILSWIYVRLFYLPWFFAVRFYGMFFSYSFMSSWREIE